MGLTYFDQFITVVFSTQLRISYLKLALIINRLKPGMVSVIGNHKRYKHAVKANLCGVSQY